MRVNRAANVSLVEQLFRELKQSILDGRYRPGERLPGIHDLAAAAGVSEKVSRQALGRLAEIGWCDAVRGRRSVVMDRGKNRRGRVLFFNATAGLDFFTSWLAGTICPQLLKGDYRLTTISAYDLKRDGSSQLLAESLKEHWDLVLECGMRVGARRALENSGLPFVVLGDGGKCIPSHAANCVGQIEVRNGKAVPEFVKACVHKRVRQVVQFLYDQGGFEVSEMLAMPGIKCTTIRTPRRFTQFEMYQDAYLAVSRFLNKVRGRLPDVFLFTDDHLAQGGLLALMEHGISIPDDVKVVSHANRGFGPIWIRPLTRIEMDPIAQGKAVARAVLAFFNTGRFPQGLQLGSEWVVGETF